MTKYYATFAWHGQHGSVTLIDDQRVWNGSFRVETSSRRREDAYEEGYRLASASAASKGGRLEWFQSLDVRA